MAPPTYNKIRLGTLNRGGIVGSIDLFAPATFTMVTPGVTVAEDLGWVEVVDCLSVSIELQENGAGGQITGCAVLGSNQLPDSVVVATRSMPPLLYGTKQHVMEIGSWKWRYIAVLPYVTDPALVKVSYAGHLWTPGLSMVSIKGFDGYDKAVTRDVRWTVQTGNDRPPTHTGASVTQHDQMFLQIVSGTSDPYDYEIWASVNGVWSLVPGSTRIGVIGNLIDRIDVTGLTRIQVYVNDHGSTPPVVNIGRMGLWRISSKDCSRRSLQYSRDLSSTRL